MERPDPATLHEQAFLVLHDEADKACRKRWGVGLDDAVHHHTGYDHEGNQIDIAFDSEMTEALYRGLANMRRALDDRWPLPDNG